MNHQPRQQTVKATLTPFLAPCCSRCWPRHPPFELFLRQRLDLQRIEGTGVAT
jgi:hypothetical protein